MSMVEFMLKVQADFKKNGIDYSSKGKQMGGDAEVYYCTICNGEPVDVLEGYDTCKPCCFNKGEDL